MLTFRSTLNPGLGLQPSWGIGQLELTALYWCVHNLETDLSYHISSVFFFNFFGRSFSYDLIIEGETQHDFSLIEVVKNGANSLELQKGQDGKAKYSTSCIPVRETVGADFFFFTSSQVRDFSSPNLCS